MINYIIILYYKYKNKYYKYKNKYYKYKNKY